MKISSEDGSFEISENDESMVMLGEDERTKVLNVLISKFKNKCDNINNWIKANPNTSVNFAELIKCISEYGELNSEYAQIYAERGTKKKVQGEQEKHIMPLLFPEMKAARDSLEEMIKLRANDEFFDDGFAKGFRNDLLSAAALGEYHIADAVTDSVKSDVLSTLASIYFYIWDTKKREPEYQYDNVNEWNGLKQNYEEYKNSVGVQERVKYTDGSIYEGPQFGSDIEDMMYRVENNLIMSDYFEKKQDVEDQELSNLNSRANELKKEYDNINNWIKANPNTSVNFAELTGCISKYGELNSDYINYFEKQGVSKTIQKETEEHIMPVFFSEMKGVRDSLEEMIKLRDNDEFFNDGFAKGFRNDLVSAAALGEYHIADAATNRAKSEVLFTLASVYFYIWDTKQREPEYQYDNVNEWNGLKQNYEKYKNSVGVQERVEYTDGSIYEGPQFGSDIEDMMYRVENNLIMSDYFEKKQDVEDQELSNLNSKANVLNNRYKGINDFIRNNRDSAPNFREMVDSVIEYGKLISEFGGYYSRTGYPVLSEENREITNFEIPMVNEEVRGAQEGIYEMMQLRGNHQFFKDATARSFMNELANVAAVGAYDIPSDPQIDNLKKDVLCQAAGIYFYIWDTQSREPNYKYDNVNEWNDLNEKYALYKESVGIQESRENAEFSIYEGPQFGRVIEDMLAEIKKYSIIQDTNVNEAHK